MARRDIERGPAAYAHLARLAEESIRQEALKVEREERHGFANVLDEAREAHMAFNAAAGLTECAGDDNIRLVHGGDLAALLRIVNARLGRAIEVAQASAARESANVVALRD